MDSARGSTIDAGRIIKVNHAGEHGATNIYAGQIAMARLRAPSLLPELAEFKAHEERHRAIFAKELKRRGLPRCRSYWLCALGGYVLGLLTGLMGAQSIASATVAVERVVLRHLRQQLLEIGNADPDATVAISAILSEEQQHHDQSAKHIRHTGVIDRLIGSGISAATEAVIWLGMRL
ncbi:demethoxyubiquinone hydroxylase family protein [Massilia norwichensis]|jgi:3-demethoxyubiquinol 3-hydroxylase|uniref:Demethoxyubiquinone hydroxylase family protein n=1 Tax=Massilia norwichensis TaxID=1442366 RepID=A0ABT2AEM7_9BURK|nr:demethoxyubiquinone hydroxylase family protein [Massilia norwichensis]MCS0592646.1 demethoxyubiquinone hydroxylase family protein [Massilia norwichensis]